MEKEQATVKRENFSRKRSAILKVLKDTECHPTADWVYAQLKPKYPNLSLGTVYRNLKKFCIDGKAASVGVINGQEHFDGCLEPHTHFTCEKCGDVFDVHETFFSDDALEKLSKSFNHNFSSVDVMFKGVCKKCEEGLCEQPA